MQFIRRKKIHTILVACLCLSSLSQAAETNEFSVFAGQILDSSTSAAQRDALLLSQTNQTARLIHELVQQIQVGTADEYRAIPAIWQIAITAAKRNNPAELKEILAVSLPKSDEPLRDWQAVVIGGGIINGLSLEGHWPDEQIKKILRNEADLKTRWLRSIKLSSLMAEDETIRAGTRYDALRMLGVAPWKTYGPQLTKYLGQNVNGELQQGAVSGLSDVPSEDVAKVLLEKFDGLNERNRQFALDALLRTDSRIYHLLQAMSESKIKFSALGEVRWQKLKSSPNEKIRERTGQLEERLKQK